MRLPDKVCLISGGARGMGAAIAQLLSDEGAKVVIGDVLEEEGNRVAAEIGEAGGDAAFISLDVTSEVDWKRATQQTTDKYGRLDVLVNNAGIYERATIEESSGEGWDRVMDINAKGVLLGCKAAIPAMKMAGGGSIVNISSVAGLVGSARSTAYHASKGAVRLLTKSTALQYAKDGIRANSVHPGPVTTEMLHLLFPTRDEMEERLANIPLGRFGTPEDVAQAVLFLASDESSFVTGSELIVDGGWTAQ